MIKNTDKKINYTAKTYRLQALTAITQTSSNGTQLFALPIPWERGIRWISLRRKFFG
jgi:hypothetical protein